jgi:hypothetical protein
LVKQKIFVDNGIFFGNLPGIPLINLFTKKPIELS